MYELLVGALGLIAFVAVLAAIAFSVLYAQEKKRKAPAAGAASPGAAPAAAPAPAAAASATPSKKLSWLAIGGIALGIAILVGILANNWDKVPGGAAGWVVAAIFGGLGIFLVMKAGSIGLWLGIPLILLAIAFGNRAGEGVLKFQNWTGAVVLDGKPITSDSADGASQNQAKWKETAKDGTIPLGVWSETFAIGVGCSTHYDAGNGTDFKVRYRFHTNEWTIHPGGKATYPPANEVQFMLLKPRTAVPVKVTCNK